MTAKLQAPRRPAPPCRLQPTAACVAVALAFAPQGVAFALPTGAQVINGQVVISRPGASQLVINQATSSAILNWNTFSIAAGEHVDFRQPSATSVLLNRVIGGAPSEIYGRLTANGQVFLVNPSGVLFGRGAEVNVGSLIASTLAIGNDDFLAGRYQFSGGTAAGKVINQGTLQAGDRGTVALLGGQVSNDGTVAARLGTAALAAGEKISLDFSGDGLTKIRVDKASIDAMVANRGMIIADGGQALMTVRAAQALTDTVLEQNGVVRARSLVERNGRIILDGGDTGVTLNGGTLDATGLDAGLNGGSIDVLGHHVGLVGTALLDASGDAGGGVIRVGGGRQGRDATVANAAATYGSADTVVRADAVRQGDGGKVIVWGDEATRFHGRISARGGSEGGDGGYVETSGKYLDVAGATVDAAAPRGKSGEWLLDPYDITITFASPDQSVGSGPDFVSSNTPAYLAGSSIAAALDSGTSVTVTTGSGGSQPGNIIIASDIPMTGTRPVSLTFNAANDIIMEAGVRITSVGTGGRLNVDFNADAGAKGSGAIHLDGNSAIYTNGGNVRFYGGSDPVNGAARGSVTDLGNNNITTYVNGISLYQSTIDVSSAGAPGGNVSMRGAGLNTLYQYPFGNAPVTLQGAGVSLSASQVVGGGGAFSLAGIGAASSPTTGAGILTQQSTVTTAGTLNLTGSVLAGEVGIGISDNQSVFTGQAGVSMTGTGGLTDGYGIRIVSGAIASAGTIALDGTGVNEGVTLESSTVTSSAGAVALTGNGGYFGLLLNLTTISAAGTATLHGTASGAGSAGTYLLSSDIAADMIDVTGSGTAQGVYMDGGSAKVTSGTVSITGTAGFVANSAEFNAGVLLHQANLEATTGNIDVAGISQGYGVTTASSTITTTAGGSIDVRGLASLVSTTVPTVGTFINGTSVVTKGGPGSIQISGEAASANTAGVRITADSTIGSAETTGDIVLRAMNAAGPDGFHRYMFAFNGNITGTGVLNLRPGGVSATGALTEALSVPINLFVPTTNYTPAAFNQEATAPDFAVDLKTLTTVIQPNFATVVFGSNAQTGRISALNGAPFSGNYDVTLQNGGAGSQGILIDTGMAAGNRLLTLSSGGPVTQGGPIDVRDLLLHGTQAQSSFTLTNPANTIATLSTRFAVAGGDVNVVSANYLDLAPLFGTGYDAATNTATVIDASSLVAGNNFSVQSGTVNSQVSDTDLRVLEDITTLSNGGTVLLSAQGSVRIGANRAITASGTGKINVDVNADSDGNTFGTISMASNALIATNGGNVRFYGVGDPVYGRASGDAGSIYGVSIENATIDTTVAGTNLGGNISLRGNATGAVGSIDVSGNVTYTYGSGVLLFNSALSSGAGSVSLNGTSVGVAGESGVGVQLIGSSVASGSGTIQLTGVSPGGDGVHVESASSIVTTGGGTIDIRGRSELVSTTVPRVGVLVDDSIVATAGGPGRILLSGESASAYTPGLRTTSSAVIGSVSTTGDIVLRALNAPAADRSVNGMLDLGGTVATSGVVNVRPGGVSALGALTEAPAMAINVFSPTLIYGINGFSIANGTSGFGLDPLLLNRVIQAGTAGVVVGSDTHTGQISVLGGAPLGGIYDMTLQNGGAGSAGITLVNGLSNPGRRLVLSSGGSVTQGGALTADSLLLHGSQAQSRFVLGNTGNTVARMSSVFDVARDPSNPFYGDVSFYTTGNLDITPLTGTGFSSVGNTASAIVSGTGGMVVAHDVIVQAAQDVTLNQNITTLGSDIALVAGGVFRNPAGASLLPGGGGTWNIFAGGRVGEVRGGLAGTAPTPNFYNCTYGAPCAATILAGGGNHFIYADQPVLGILLDNPDPSRLYGSPNPAFTYSVTGLLAGDNLANVFAGGFGTTALATSNVGSYAVQGSFVSPVGYLVQAQPGTLTVTPATLTYAAAAAARLVGAPNPAFSGAVNGFVAGDTLATATTGTAGFTSAADGTSVPGNYGITGTGLLATNYVFRQAPGNATALRVDAVPVVFAPTPAYLAAAQTYFAQTQAVSVVDLSSSDVYGKNYGNQSMCAGTGPLGLSSAGAAPNDRLATEWARVKSSPNLSNCIGLAQRNSCDSY